MLEFHSSFGAIPQHPTGVIAKALLCLSSYVNSNYVLLALICEQVSGQSFATFCHERMFGPLGMTRSVINDSFVKLIPGRALGYYNDEQGN